MNTSAEQHSRSAVWHASEGNPSAWGHRICICVLASVAGAIALYLGLYQWRVLGAVWDPIFGQQSEEVVDSNVSLAFRHWFSLPDAVVGALAYFGEAMLSLAGSVRRWRDRPWLVTLFGLNVTALVLASASLVLLQATVIGAWCLLCLMTASISVLLAVLANGEVRSCLRYLFCVWSASGRLRDAWDAFRGKPSETADAVGLRLSRTALSRGRA